jgi:hypothetical protein
MDVKKPNIKKETVNDDSLRLCEMVEIDFTAMPEPIQRSKKETVVSST